LEGAKEGMVFKKGQVHHLLRAGYGKPLMPSNDLVSKATISTSGNEVMSVIIILTKKLFTTNRILHFSNSYEKKI